MIIYSHKFDFIVKLIIFALLVSTMFLFDIDYLQQQIVSQFNLKTSQVEFIFCLGICVELVLLWFILYIPFLSPLASWFYIRFTLKTPVTWTIAKQLSPFLSINLRTMQWIPMLFIKDLPEEKRMEALMQIINHPPVQKSNSHLDLFLREKLSKKAYNLYIVLTVIMSVWHLYGFIDGSGIVGYLNNLETNLFSNSYYPFVNFVLATVFSSILAAGASFIYDSIFTKKQMT